MQYVCSRGLLTHNAEQITQESSAQANIWGPHVGKKSFSLFHVCCRDFTASQRCMWQNVEVFFFSGETRPACPALTQALNVQPQGVQHFNGTKGIVVLEIRNKFYKFRTTLLFDVLNSVCTFRWTKTLPCGSNLFFQEVSCLCALNFCDSILLGNSHS